MADVQLVLRARDLASADVKRLRLEIERLATGVGATNVRTQLLSRNLRNLRSGFNALRSVIVATGLAFAAREYLQAITTFQNLTNRLRLVTDTSQQLVNAQQAVIDIADETRNSVGATGAFYGRLALASEELGLSQRRLANITRTVNQAVAISGTTAESARAGLIQFSQGLASGRLAGDELRSVLENIPALGSAIAQGLGVARGELRRLGAEGRLTPIQVITALETMGDEVQEQFDQIEPTITQQWTRLTNQLAELFGRDSVLGQAIGDTLGFVADLARDVNQSSLTPGTDIVNRGLSAARGQLPDLSLRERADAETAAIREVQARLQRRERAFAGYERAFRAINQQQNRRYLGSQFREGEGFGILLGGHVAGSTSRARARQTASTEYVQRFYNQLFTQIRRDREILNELLQARRTVSREFRIAGPVQDFASLAQQSADERNQQRRIDSFRRFEELVTRATREGGEAQIALIIEEGRRRGERRRDQLIAEGEYVQANIAYQEELNRARAMAAQERERQDRESLRQQRVAVNEQVRINRVLFDELGIQTADDTSGSTEFRDAIELRRRRAIEAQANLNRERFGGPNFASPDSIADFGDSIGEAVEETNALRDALADTFQGVNLDNIKLIEEGFYGVADSIQETVNASLKAGDSFSEFSRKIAASLANSLAAALAEFATISAAALGISAILGPQAGSAFFTAYYNRSGGLSAGIVGALGDSIGVERAHNGGIITRGGVRRFAGLGADEVPIIAQTGEMIVPRGGGGGGVIVNVSQQERRNRFQRDIEVEQREDSATGRQVINLVVNSMNSGELGRATQNRFGVRPRVAGRG